MPAFTVALPIGAREPLGEFESLVTAVKEALDREDLTKVQISNFIALAEAKFNRVLRVPQMEQYYSVPITEGVTAYELPSNFLKARSVKLRDACPVYETSPQSDLSPAFYTITRNPRSITLHDRITSGTLDVLYYAALSAIDENRPDNWLLNDYPDIYYYGTLMQAEAFHANDERVPLWSAALENALAELQAAGNGDRYGSGPLTPRTNLMQVHGARI